MGLTGLVALDNVEGNSHGLRKRYRVKEDFSFLVSNDCNSGLGGRICL